MISYNICLAVRWDETDLSASNAWTSAVSEINEHSGIWIVEFQIRSCLVNLPGIVCGLVVVFVESSHVDRLRYQKTRTEDAEIISLTGVRNVEYIYKCRSCIIEPIHFAHGLWAVQRTGSSQSLRPGHMRRAAQFSYWALQFHFSSARAFF